MPIRKVRGGYRLTSRRGRNLGTFRTRRAAVKHGGQVAYFKAEGKMARRKHHRKTSRRKTHHRLPPRAANGRFKKRKHSRRRR